MADRALPGFPPKTQDVTDEDKIIVNYKINVRPEDVTITPVAQVFQ